MVRISNPARTLLCALSVLAFCTAGQVVDAQPGVDDVLRPLPPQPPVCEVERRHDARFSLDSADESRRNAGVVQCSGNGRCIADASRGRAACACKRGWAGERCEWCIGAKGMVCPGFDVDVSQSPGGTEVTAVRTSPARRVASAAPAAARKPVLGDDVREAIRRSRPRERIAVSISVRTRSHVPGLPRLRTDLDRNDPANLALKALRDTVRQDFQERRLPEMAWVVRLIERTGGHVRSVQALGSIVFADVPAATLRRLANQRRIAGIVLLDAKFEAPSINIANCGNIGTTVGCGSADQEGAGDACEPVSITEHAVTLRLNQLRQAGFGADGYIVGVLDSGAADHVMLDGTVVAHHACNTVFENCQDEEPFDIQEGTGHGTATHSIIAGNTALGNLDRGITHAQTESWRVYELVSNGGPKGIADAVAAGNEVLLLQVQSIDGPPFTNMESPAEEAFDAGAVVVGVTGNGHDFAPCALEMGPLALVPNIITTGAYALFGDEFVPFARQQVGNVEQHAVIKPDIVMPSFARGASKDCADCLDENGFSSTSGAGPFAAAMAVQILDRVASLAPQNTPARDLAGVIHAAMIAFGTNGVDIASNDRLNLEGAGRAYLRRPACSRWKFGKTVVDAGTTTEIDVEPSVFGTQGAHAAIWWPQAMDGTHNRVSLRLVDEEFDLSWTSDHPTSVFQNVLLDFITLNDWRIEITNQANADQEVFYFFRHGFPDFACNI